MRIAGLLLAAATFSSAAHASDTSVPDRTLVRLARVAELYRDSALGFSCDESIVWSGSESGHIRFAYLFVRDDHGKLRDYRTWKTGKGGAEVDPRDYQVPRYLESAYLWAFVFRADRQPLYRFTLQSEETPRDRGVMVIEFAPLEPVRKGLNDWAGFARVDWETSQLLEFEAYSPRDWDTKRRRDAAVALAPERSTHKSLPPFDVERIVTTFGYEKNALRLPSHVTIETLRTTIAPGLVHAEVRESTLRKVTQDYTSFEFFSVRSTDEILRFVNGEEPLRPVP